MFSNRIKRINTSPIMKYTNVVKDLEKQNIKIYKLNIAQPDTATDLSYYDALKNINIGINGYSNPVGHNELREKVALYCNEKNNNNIYTSANVVVTNGASDAIIKILLSLCDCNDEIIILEPFFSDYLIYCKMLNIKVKSISYNNLNIEKIEKLITNRTKAILFGNPNNPDGSILSIDDIEMLLQVAKRNNLFIISDEVYNEIVYSEKYITLLNFKYKNIVVVDSMSKKFCNCGSRIGFAITKNKDLLKMLYKINDGRISLSNTEQLAASNMFDNHKIIFNNVFNVYSNKMKQVVNQLIKNKNIKFKPPQGGLSILIDLPADGTKFCAWLLEEFRYENQTLLITPAEDFYLSKDGKNKIRITITLSDNDMIRAIEILEIALADYLDKEKKL